MQIFAQVLKSFFGIEESYSKGAYGVRDVVSTSLPYNKPASSFALYTNYTNTLEKSKPKEECTVEYDSDYSSQSDNEDNKIKDSDCYKEYTVQYDSSPYFSSEEALGKKFDASGSSPFVIQDEQGNKLNLALEEEQQQVKQISQTPSSKKNDSSLVCPGVQSVKSTDASGSSPFAIQNQLQNQSVEKQNIQKTNFRKKNKGKFPRQPNLRQGSKLAPLFSGSKNI